MLYMYVVHVHVQVCIIKTSSNYRHCQVHMHINNIMFLAARCIMHMNIYICRSLFICDVIIGSVYIHVLAVLVCTVSEHCCSAVLICSLFTL